MSEGGLAIPTQNSATVRPNNDVQSVNRNEVDPILTRLKRILRKFRKDELATVVATSAVFKIAEVDINRQPIDKEALIKGLISVLEDVSEMQRIVPLLELLYIRLHSNMRTWHVLQVRNMEEQQENVTPEYFQKLLSDYLNRSKYEVNVTCQLYEEGLWTRISFTEPVRKRSQMVVFKESTSFLLYYPWTPYVLYCDLKVAHQELVQRAILQTLRGTKVKKLPLTGHKISALIQLAWQKDNCRFEENEGLPYVIKKELKKRKPKEFVENSNIVNEHEHEYRKQEDYVEKQFGIYEQPSLENILYSIKTSFYGLDASEKNELDDHQVVCTVNFKGQSVLEGIRELVCQGIADRDLPDYVGNLSHLGVNKVTIKEDK
ncbi:centromere protein N-like [Limulus polyphemus]|uniref:Centromere protein N-like n=1 Tax=Limulus polyphemus TaxID=6850 RepID=A0ABM1BPW6_LIMPO|nr:centromere protein N-like [Limulus polyphemus]